MRYSAFTKAVAMLLAVLLLTVALISGIGMVFAANAGIYGKDYDTWYQQYREEEAQRLATALAESYATRALGGFTRYEQQYIGWGNDPEVIGQMRDLTEGSWCYSVARNGLVCETDYTKAFDGQAQYRFTIAVRYPQKASANEDWDQCHFIYEERGGADESKPTVAPGYGGNGDNRHLYVRMETSPKYTVTVCFMENAITDYAGVPISLCRLLIAMQYYLIASLCAGLLLGILCLLWLFIMAGKTHKNGAVCPGGLNRLPLDLYGAAAAGLCTVCVVYAWEIAEEFFYHGDSGIGYWMIPAALLMLVGVLCVTGFLFAVAAQWKEGWQALWRRSVIGWCVRWLTAGLRKCFVMLCKLYNLLPLIWQYLLTALAMAGVPLLLGFFFLVSYGFVRGFWLLTFFCALLADVALVLYGAYAYGTILRGAKKMAAGELHTKVDTARLYGIYKDCGENLNALAEVSVTAARNQMKSERMKAELITNVSHDIKTPLTSIINYIDLLEKAETEEQRTAYLQVLDRQSQRLKKLIEDLMDMSKASTGNLSVDIGPMDAVEAINQALGEFSDKFKGQSLTVLFAPPEKAVPILADGKLTWRVLSNILGNAVKYAMPGTRVYVDMEETDRQVAISIKNISGEPLNISAEELMERFVRGDASRNTEGSGLGLNIAQSLMQLQKGSLHLTVDGDLFKTVLQFPKA